MEYDGNWISNQILLMKTKLLMRMFLSKKYRFFIQQFCQIVYDNSSKQILSEDVWLAKKKFYDVWDKRFFTVRCNRCTEYEKRIVSITFQVIL